jgi:hypothetical protein
MHKRWIDIFAKIAIFIFLFLNCSLLYAQEWTKIDGEICRIEYEQGVDLSELERKLDLTSVEVMGLRRDLIGLSTLERLTGKVEIVARKVKQILNMYPIGYEVRLKVFKDRHTLQECYKDIFGQRKEIISFYVYKHNTIYTSQSDISEHVLAHELAHSIIDHYFVILPPENIAEMLAKYVDSHLKD